MRITASNIQTELRFKGDIEEIKEIIKKIQTEEKSGKERNWGKTTLRDKANMFLRAAFQIESINELNNTKAMFTQLDIADMLDDFIDYVEGMSFEELTEKSKKRRLARLAQEQRRGIY